MSHMNRMAQFSIKHSDKIKKICLPLFQDFGVKHFWCSKTFNSGKFLCLGSNPELHEYYYASKSYLHNPFFRAPEIIQPGYYFHRDYYDQEYVSIVHDYIEKFKTEFCTVFIIKSKNELIRIGYASAENRGKEFNHLLINNMQLFQKFNEYFLREANELLLKADDYCVDLKSELGSVYYEKLKFPSLLDKKEQCAFLDHLGLIKSSKVEKLSHQELHCMKYVAQGFSNAQIAYATGLSIRTVEHYLESSKSKLFCNTKFDLFQLAHLLQTSCEYFFDV